MNEVSEKIARIDLEECKQIGSGSIAVIGGGPAGLMAAEVMLEQGQKVEIYDAMPSLGRKFLRAGKGGLNLTHSENLDTFLSRYGSHRSDLEPIIKAFPPAEIKKWVAQLGFQTFVGSSGRVFPKNFNSSPILRTWLSRLKDQGLIIHSRHRWVGWDHRFHLYFESPDGKKMAKHNAVVVALGGGSWPQLGSDGGWVALFRQKEILVHSLKPANCGFDLDWSPHFRERFHGKPVKPVVLSMIMPNGETVREQGEFIVTKAGLEGSVIYFFSSILRDEIEENGTATIHLDLVPDWTYPRLLERLSEPRGSRTVATHLKKAVGIEGVKAGLLYEVLNREDFNIPERVAKAIKMLPLTLISPRPLEEAISSAGGVAFEEMDHNLMLRKYPGMFCAGEMLDWEAPTGGYLLSACFASGRWVGRGAAAWLSNLENIKNT